MMICWAGIQGLTENFLKKATAPRFHSMPFLSNTEKEETFTQLMHDTDTHLHDNDDPRIHVPEKRKPPIFSVFGEMR